MPEAAPALRKVLDPAERAEQLGLDWRLQVSAVWPVPHGFIVRLETQHMPGVPEVWVRWCGEFEIWPFPRDPELPALEALVEAGWSVLGHRLGQRATLRSADGLRVLHLRPAPSAARVFGRLEAVRASLASGRVPVVSQGSFSVGIRGLCVAHIASIPATAEDDSMWEEIGTVLARAHACEPPPGLRLLGPSAASDAVARQIGIASCSGSAFTRWLVRTLSQWLLIDPFSGGSRAALVHGDFHPGHVIRRYPPVFLDWEQAGIGDPEQDLGNLAAHLYWERGVAGGAALAAVRRGYGEAGGIIERRLLEHYARLALIRVLAVRALRDSDRDRVRTSQAEWAAWPEVVRRW